MDIKIVDIPVSMSNKCQHLNGVKLIVELNIKQNNILLNVNQLKMFILHILK